MAENANEQRVGRNSAATHPTREKSHKEIAHALSGALRRRGRDAQTQKHTCKGSARESTK